MLHLTVRHGLTPQVVSIFSCLLMASDSAFSFGTISGGFSVPRFLLKRGCSCSLIDIFAEGFLRELVALKCLWCRRFRVSRLLRCASVLGLCRLLWWRMR